MWVVEPRHRLESAMRSSPEYIFHLLGIWPTQKNRRLSLFAWQRWRLGAAGCLGFDGTQMAALITGGETNKHKHSGFSFYSAFFFFCFSLVGGRNGVDAKHARYYYVHSSVGNEWRFSFFLCLSVFWLNHYSSLIVSISYSSKNNFIIFCFWNCSWF